MIMLRHVLMFGRSHLIAKVTESVL